MGSIAPTGDDEWLPVTWSQLSIRNISIYGKNGR
jgi:hypothetical protein